MTKTPVSPDVILFEDNHIIIVNKAPSEIVQGDKTGDITLSEKVSEYIRINYNKPGDAFIGVVHRLDRPVSGAIIFARTSKALTRLNEMLKNRQIHKTYWAVVKNKPPFDSQHLTHYLKRNQSKNFSSAFNEPVKDSLKSDLIYTVISKSDNYFLLEVNLLTGRHHQIRAQLSAIGCPIKGDIKYGFNRTNSDASIHLHAVKIEFTHPVRNEPLCIKAPPPPDPLWQAFYKDIKNRC